MIDNSRVRLAAAVVAALVTLLGCVAPASASTPHYRNCTQMHAHYRGGIARSGARDHRVNGGHAKYKPYVNTAYYTANESMDRDKDGVACEQ